MAGGPDQTVFDDGVRDVLIGNGGRDWFFARLADDEDVILDQASGELADEPD